MEDKLGFIRQSGKKEFHTDEADLGKRWIDEAKT
jgi:hypothetical protein